VPIAVPESCNQNEFANLKILFSMMIVSICKKSFVGKFLGSSVRLSKMKSQIADNPVVVSIFVYMDFASAVKSRAPSGICSCFSSFISVNEFVM